MKTFIVILLLVLSFSVNAQECPKRTNKLIANTGLSKEDNFLKVGQTLIDNNFEIDVKDRDFYTISTKQKMVNGTDGYALNFIIKDSIIILTGKIKSNIKITMYGVQSEGHWFRVENKGGLSNPFRQSFNEMYDLFKKISINIDCITEELKE